MQNLQSILTNEEYTVYTAYCVKGRKLWEIVDDTGIDNESSIKPYQNRPP